MLAASWMFFSLVSLTSYVAMLTASFTLPTLSPTLNTLQELLDSDFSWGIQVAFLRAQFCLARDPR